MLWIHQELIDFGVLFNQTPIKCDNTSSISLLKNLVLHSRTKHIELRHHFLRDHVQNQEIILEFVPIDFQLVDIFTKPLPKDRFNFIRRELELLILLDRLSV